MIKLIILWITADSKTREAAISVLKGEKHARTYPKKVIRKGDKLFGIVES